MNMTLRRYLYTFISRYVFPNKGVTHIKRSTQLVVSLTSHPGRIDVVEKTIDSLLRQSIKPDAVVLWLEETKFPNREKSLPKSLLRYRKFGLSIKWYVKEIRSYCKLVPELKDNPDVVIVTADDDVLYPEDWLEKLYVSYLKYPNEIHCHHAYGYYVNNDDMITRLDVDNTVGYLSKSVIPMGVGGVLYPPASLFSDVTNEDVFCDIAPTNDDFWFWAMGKLNDTKSRLVEGYVGNIVCIDGTQDCGLCNNENDMTNIGIQFKNIIEKYPTLKNQILHDISSKKEK